MKKTGVFISTFVIFCLVQVGWGQVGFDDDFIDDEIDETSSSLTDPDWDGDISSFAVTDPSVTGDDSHVLGNVAPSGSATETIVTESSITQGNWKFSIATKSGNNPSHSNQIRIILMSDSNDITELEDPDGGSWNGYYVEYGQNGSTDKLILYRHTSGSGKIERIDTSFPGAADDDDGSTYIVSRNGSNEWSIKADDGFEGVTATTSTGPSVTDATHTSSSYFAISIEHTSASSRIFYVDNIRAENIDNSLPVELTLFTATSQKGAVKLNWATESEIDNLGFLIDRSLEPNSGFTTVADYRFVPELQGQGSVTYRTDYSYNDREVVPGTKYYYVLSDVTGNPVHGEPVTRHTDKMVSAMPKWHDESSALINGFKTFKAYPNPFNPKTVIVYELEDVRKLSVNIVNVYGRQITELYNGIQASGYHEVVWQPKDISAGIYFCHLTSGGDTITRKLVLLK